MDCAHFQSRNAFLNRKKLFLIVIGAVLVFGCSFGMAINTETAFGLEKAHMKSELTTTSANPKLNKKTVKLVYGKTDKLKVTNANGKAITWKSSNSKVVKITKKKGEQATIKAMSAGTATVTAKVGGKTLKCKVAAVGKLNKTNVTLWSFNNTYQLKLSGAKAKSWKSSIPKVASVKNGKITLNAIAGKTTITCVDTKGNKYKCNVNVKHPNLSCEMVQTIRRDFTSGTYYFKEFTFANYSNFDVVLDYDLICYYPYEGLNPRDDMVALEDLRNYEEIGPTHRVEIPSGQVSGFYGLEGESYYPIEPDGEFGYLFRINGIECVCIFATSGELRSCGPFTLDS